MSRLVRVELRKMADTRAGMWLLIGIAVLVGVVSTIFMITADQPDRTFVKLIAAAAVRHGSRVLDVAAGSGDIAIGMARKAGGGQAGGGRVVLTDLKGPMLAEGARRIVDAGLLPGTADCVQADGTRLAFADNSFDVVSIAFGIRNFVDIEAGLREFRRVLRPGGQFICLEFSRPVLPLLDVAYDAYSFNIIPAIGEIITGDRAAGSITAAQFLQRFVNEVPWAHLDIAGVAWSKKDHPTVPKGGTGFGVRLLERFVRDNFEGK